MEKFNIRVCVHACMLLYLLSQMSILSEGEVVNELMIIVDGEVQGARSGSAAALAHSSMKRKGSQNDDQMAMGLQNLKVMSVCMTDSSA